MDAKKILSVVWDYFLISVGTLIFCMAWTSFLQPNNLASGGLTGLTTILDYATKENSRILLIKFRVHFFEFLFEIPETSDAFLAPV